MLVWCPINSFTFDPREPTLGSVNRAGVITLSSEEQSTLATWAGGRSLPLRLVQRAQIIQMAAAGMLNREIAQELDISRPTVQLWRDRFLGLRLAGLEKDAPRPGRIPEIPQAKVAAVMEATLHSTPKNATHWSVRTMAKSQGISRWRFSAFGISTISSPI